MNTDRPVVESLEDDFKFTSSGPAYIAVPTKKMLKFNIKDVKTTEQIDGFKTKPDGTPNPKYGTPQTMFIFEFQLNDSRFPEANGQVYSKWVSSAVSDKSNLGKVSDAVWGSPTAILEHTKGDFIGLPVQAALTPGKKDPERLNIDIDKLMPATDDQETLVADVVLTDIPEGGVSDAELDEVFK